MLKKELTTHLVLTFIWLTLITLIRWQWQVDLIFLWLGALVGTFLLDIDHLLYVFVIYPYELTSQRVKHLWQEKHFKETFLLLVQTHEERLRLSFHNAVFQVFFYVFCFFVLSSTNSLFGKGLVLAVALHLLKDEWHYFLEKREEFLRQWLFWPLKREITLENQRLFLLLMLALFLSLNFFLI